MFIKLIFPQLAPGLILGGQQQPSRTCTFTRVELRLGANRLSLPSQLWSATFRGMDSVLLANEALKLPAWERAQIIDALWRSLDPAEQAAVDEAWLAESHYRLEAFRHGKLKALDGEATLGEIETNLRS